MIEYDVAVYGAGPAGSLAAFELARKGLRIAIVDGSERETHKIGESLPGIGLRLLRSLGIDDSEFGEVQTRIGGNLSCWASAELEATDFFCDPDGPGWRLSRRRFDAGLVSAAESAGVVFFRSSVEKVASRWVIDATGRSSSIARKFGVRRVRDEGLVAVWGLGSPRSGEHFDRTLIEAVPEGWWYGATLPDGRAVLALHVRPEDARSVRKDWIEILSRTLFIREFFPAAGFGEQLYVADAGGSRLECFHGERWIACGDAALSFDPLSSQGIYTAMYSGLAAARAIVATEAGDPMACAKYAARLEEIRRVYLARLADSYRMVSRWPDSPFWAARG